MLRSLPIAQNTLGLFEYRTCSDGPLPGTGVHGADLVVVSEQGLNVRSVVHRPDLHRPYSMEGESQTVLRTRGCSSWIPGN